MKLINMIIKLFKKLRTNTTKLKENNKEILIYGKNISDISNERLKEIKANLRQDMRELKIKIRTIEQTKIGKEKLENITEELANKTELRLEIMSELKRRTLETREKLKKELRKNWKGMDTIEKLNELCKNIRTEQRLMGIVTGISRKKNIIKKELGVLAGNDEKRNELEENLAMMKMTLTEKQADLQTLKIENAALKELIEEDIKNKIP